MLQRVRAIIRKEFMHIMRDWQTLVIVLLMPVMMMFLYGYALNTDLQEVPVAVIDPSMTQEVKNLAATIDALPLFHVVRHDVDRGDAAGVMLRERVKAVVRFPAGFFRHHSTGAIQLLVDGSDPTTATVVGSSLQAVILQTLGAPNAGRGIEVRYTVLYNPRQRSALFFIPGLMAVILLMVSAMLTSLAITKEKESGSVALLLVSPLRPVEIVAGKILPYCLLAFLDGVIIQLVGAWVFDVHCAGSLLLLSLLSALYIGVALAIGLLVSTVAENQQQAMMMVLPVTMMPTMILSGFIFPLQSLPQLLQMVSRVIPATYYLTIIRGIMLKGNGIAQLAFQTGVLGGMFLLLLAVTVKRFRSTL